MQRSKRRKLTNADSTDVLPLDADEPKDEILQLNVGGVEFVTFRSTLLSNSNTYFSKRFGGKFNDGPKLDDQYFIDRNGKQFEIILEYLRNGDNVILPSSIDELKKLMLEARYYCLASLIKLIDDAIGNLEYEQKWELTSQEKVMVYVGKRIGKLSRVINKMLEEQLLGYFRNYESDHDLIFNPVDPDYDGP